MTIKLVTDADGTVNGVMTGVLQFVTHLKPRANKFNQGSTEYSVEVESTSDDDLKQIKAAGAVKKTFRTNEKTGEFYLGPTGKKLIAFKSPGSYPDGNPAPPPLVVDSEGKKVTVEIANGSEGIVQFVIKKGKNSQFGPSTRLVAIKITKLIPYERKERSAPNAALLGLTKDQLVEATKTVEDDLESTLNTPSILS